MTGIALCLISRTRPLSCSRLPLNLAGNLPVSSDLYLSPLYQCNILFMLLLEPKTLIWDLA